MNRDANLMPIARLLRRRVRFPKFGGQLPFDPRVAIRTHRLAANAFGDAIIPGEAPHRRDLLSPGVQRVAQLNHLRQWLLSQQGDHPQQLRRLFRSR